jgi:glycosyltransferase involved in cell wall biosynthesis
MHVLFIHEAFPAQFGRLALELTRRFGWRCDFLVEEFSLCPAPTQDMLQTLKIEKLPVSAESRAQRLIPWPQMYGHYLELCRVVFETIRARPGPQPDLVVAHGGCGAPILFLPEILSCPLVVYCEYYFAASHCDLSYRIDLPPAEPAPFYPRCINAITLAGLVPCTAGYAPTQWQRQRFPKRFWPKIEVHFDGIDTELYRPHPAARVIAGKTVPPGVRIVTYVARGLESMRGFDQFMKVAKRLDRERSDVFFVVIGGDKVHYGWDQFHTGGQPSFKTWVLEQDDYDLSRFLFLEHVPPEQLADILCLSDLHIYLTVPFVPSWSLFNALACGCVVLASDVEPVREIIEPGRTGLLAPFFDIERLTESALGVLADPASHQPLRQEARTLIEERYSLDVTVPRLRDYFERVKAG